jgi:hypothetical protein
LQKQRQVKLRREHSEDGETLPTEDGARQNCKREKDAGVKETAINCDSQQKARRQSRADRDLRCWLQPIE